MNQPWRSKRHVQCRTATGTSTGGGHSSAGFHQRSSDIVGCCCRDRKSGGEPRPSSDLDMAELADWWRQIHSLCNVTRRGAELATTSSNFQRAEAAASGARRKRAASTSRCAHPARTRAPLSSRPLRPSLSEKSPRRARLWQSTGAPATAPESLASLLAAP
jgi:hypothetical protein